MYQFLIAIQMIHHEKPTLEVRKVTKLLRRDTTSSNDDFTSYRLSIKLIPTTSTIYLVKDKTPDSYPEGATLSKFIHEGRPTTTKPTFVALPNLTNHSTFHECSRGIFYHPQYSPSRSFDETWCDYSLFPTPGKKDHITIDIHYSLEHHNGIYTDKVDLLNFKEDNDPPIWYPIFQLPYKIDVKVTCTGVQVYVEIIYIDLSPDPDIFAPYAYCDPSDEFIRCLYRIPSKENYISNH